MGLSGKEYACQCRRCKRHGFGSWVGKIPWRMATHSSVFAWKIPLTEEPAGLQFTGLQKSQAQLRDWAQMRILLSYKQGCNEHLYTRPLVWICLLLLKPQTVSPKDTGLLLYFYPNQLLVIYLRGRGSQSFVMDRQCHFFFKEASRFLEYILNLIFIY